ncbi:MAG: suppressor of glycerol defect [Alyxoria varia]|nr:MAG: suppressor of glycerol defect [Alyxoria varia]
MSIYTGPRLPIVLRDQFSKPDGRPTGKAHKQGQLGRKERRKSERTRGKISRKPRHDRSVEEAGRKVDRPISEKESDSRKPKPRAVRRTTYEGEPSRTDETRDVKTKRTAERKRKEEAPPIDDQESATPSLSKKDQRKLAEDDVRIASLEKKLGIKKKQKLPKSFDADGLGGLLDDLGDDDDNEDDDVNGSGRKKRKRGADEQWLESKRRKSAKDNNVDPGSEVSEADWSDGDEVLDGSDGEGVLLDLSDSGEEEEENDVAHGLEDDALSEDGSEPPPEPHPKQRENPYVPPVTDATSTTPKYVPPSLRQPSMDDTELSARIKRQAQGQLNRLSEGNILSIVSEVEKLYYNNPRQYVTSSIVELLLSTICDRTSLLDSFIILHAGFIAALYRLVGSDFGARMLERIVEKLDGYRHEDPLLEQGKQANNLLALISHLYNLQVISCNLIFDYIRQLMAEISEPHTEILLRTIRSCGSQLRQDDPTALKDIVLTLQKKIAEIGSEQNLSVRTRFMIETIGNLKDNRMKSNGPGLMSEQVTSMRKTLGTLNNSGARTLKAQDPLRVGLAEVRDKEKKGRWWMPGATTRSGAHNNHNSATTTTKASDYSNVDDNDHQESADRTITAGDVEPAADADGDPLQNLSSNHRLNTPTRRAILSILLSSTDHHDAHTRLQKLHLTKSQRLHIPHVVLHCVETEPVYNPYYEIIGRKLCGDGVDNNDQSLVTTMDEDDVIRDRSGKAVAGGSGAQKKMRNAFVFGAWDLYRRIGLKSHEPHDNEDSDSASSDEEKDDQHKGSNKNRPTRLSLANYGQFFGNLVAHYALPLSSIVKHLDLLMLYRRYRQIRRGGPTSSLLPSTAKSERAEKLALTFVEVLLFTVVARRALRMKGKGVKEVFEGDKGLEGEEEDVDGDGVSVGARKGLRVWYEKVLTRSRLVEGDEIKEREKVKLRKAVREVCEWLEGDGE